MSIPGWKRVAVGCVAMLAACVDATGSTGDPMQLRRAIDQWNALAIDDYRMEIRPHDGTLGGGAIITVQNGEPVSVQMVALYEGTPASFFEDFDTVEELFYVLVGAHNLEADRIDVKYHRHLGVPVDVYIDPESNVAGDQHGFVIEAFEVLQS
ncbi:MAG TPA: DUF6174 domain-containing protein [Longimicrobium sp.]|nr:DUF6174 domain-containing protein [Longimicrobium sp.]